MQEALGEPDAEPDVVRHRAPAVDRSAAPTRSSCSSAGASSRSARTTSCWRARTASYAQLYALQLFDERATSPDRDPDCAPDADGAGAVMIKSMTGFASLTREDDGATIAVTMRAVNHRYPRSAAARCRSRWRRSRARVARWSQQRVARGRVEAERSSLQLRQPPARRGRVQRGVRWRARRARSSARASAGWSAGALTPGDLLRLPQALDDPRARSRGRRAALADERRAALVERSWRGARADLDAMRAAKGDSPARRSRQRGARRSPRSRRAHRRRRRRAGQPRSRRVCASASPSCRPSSPADDDGRRAGDRAHRRRGPTSARRSRASAATWRTGARSPTAPSRAAASSISCCRR